MRLFVSGSREFGAAVLQLCLDLGHDVAGVASPPMATNGLRLDRLRDHAEQSGVEWQPAERLRADTLPAGIDLIIAAHSHAFIGRDTRNAAKLGGIGYHPSLLPLHRGRDSIEWAMRMRERVTGGTVYWLSDGIDAGDVAAQRHVFIRHDDTPRTLWERELFPLGLKLLRDVLEDLSNGIMVRAPQDRAVATWEPSIGRPPVFRPELPLLGSIQGFEVRARA